MNILVESLYVTDLFPFILMSQIGFLPKFAMYVHKMKSRIAQIFVWRHGKSQFTRGYSILYAVLLIYRLCGFTGFVLFWHC